MKGIEKEIVGEMKSTDAIRADVLESFEYEYPERDIELDISTEEFTSVCPKSGLPDFATIRINFLNVQVTDVPRGCSSAWKNARLGFVWSGVRILPIPSGRCLQGVENTQAGR